EGLDRAQQVDQASAESVYCPGHYYVKTASLRVPEHFIEPRSGPPLGTADTGLVVFLNDFPAPSRRYLAQLPQLILDRLPVGRCPDVNCGTFCHWASICG